MTEYFTVYGRSDCRYCTEALRLLDKHNVSGEYINTDHNPSLKALLKASGYTMLPQVFEDARHIGGYAELKAYLED